MVTEKLVYFKADIEQLELFDSLCFNLGIKRHHLLNFLLYYACHSFKDIEQFNLLVAYSRALKSSFMEEDHDFEEDRPIDV